MNFKKIDSQHGTFQIGIQNMLYVLRYVICKAIFYLLPFYFNILSNMHLHKIVLSKLIAIPL